MGTAVLKMANKGMLINAKVPAKQLLETVNGINKLLEISEKSLIEYKKEEEKDEIIETTEEIIEDDVNNKEIKDVLKKLDQQAHEIEKMRMELDKKLLKKKIEDNIDEE